MEEQELIERIVKALVDNPESARVKTIEGQKSSIIELRVDPSDMGKIIGKQGRIIQSIRTILSAASAKNKRQIVLELID